MTSNDSVAHRPAGPGRGRPRDDTRTKAILDAAGELLLESGFDHLTIQAVAERAGSGTGAIYRRWQTKEALIADAIRALPDYEPDETDDPEADLHALVLHKIEALSAAPDLLTGAVTAIRTSDEIASAVRDRYNDDAFERAIARVVGDRNPHLPTLESLTTALALHQAVFKGAVADPPVLARQIVRLILDVGDTTS